MSRPPLEVHIHLSDGQTVRFAQDDPGLAQYIIDQVQPERIFSQPQLQIAREHALSNFLTAHVVRVDFSMAEPPDWPYPWPILDSVEITGNEVIERFKPDTYASLFRDGIREAQEIETFAEIRVANGKGVYTMNRIQLAPTTPMDRALMLHNSHGDLGTMMVRRRSGGVILFNPAHVLAITMYPGPKDHLSAWPGRYSSG